MSNDAVPSTHLAKLSRQAIPPKIRQRLIDHWLPVLLTAQKQRYPVKCVLLVLLILPTLLIASYFIVALVSAPMSNLGVVELASVTILVTAFSVVGVGRVQACDDAVSDITLALHMDDAARLTESVSALKCYRKLGGVLDDAIRIARGAHV